MGDVELLRAMYDRDKKIKKWWHRIFFALKDLTRVNSYEIYQKLSFNARDK